MDEFDEWYRTARPGMQRALTTWCGDAALAADALDEAFARALERWGRVSAMTSPAGWVWRTAANQVRRTTRRSQREREAFQHMAAATTATVSVPVGADLDLRRAITRLPERQRTAVVLHYVADLATNDVAEAMGIAPGTVAATLHAARARLAVEIASPQVIDPARIEGGEVTR